MKIFSKIFLPKIFMFFMGLLTKLQNEVGKRSLPAGRWPCGTGQSAGTETNCHARMGLDSKQEHVHRKAVEVLLRTQHADGNWPAFEGDGSEGCWTTALAAITLRFVGAPTAPLEKALRWLADNKAREGHWLWKWKFRTADRAVQFNPDKYGWSSFLGTVSWVIPTALSVIALRQSLSWCQNERATTRIHLGTEMLLDRACPQGGWKACKGIVFGAALSPHVDAIAIALLALASGLDSVAMRGMNWLWESCVESSSSYSLALSTIALSVHRDGALDRCIPKLSEMLSAKGSVFPVELSASQRSRSTWRATRNPYQAVT